MWKSLSSLPLLSCTPHPPAAFYFHTHRAPSHRPHYTARKARPSPGRSPSICFWMLWLICCSTTAAREEYAMGTDHCLSELQNPRPKHRLQVNVAVTCWHRETETNHTHSSKSEARRTPQHQRKTASQTWMQTLVNQALSSSWGGGCGETSWNPPSWSGWELFLQKKKRKSMEPLNIFRKPSTVPSTV